MESERTAYLNDEEIDRRAEFKLDATGSAYLPFGVFVKKRFLWFSWWRCVCREATLERATDHLQQLSTLPRRFTRKVVPKP